MRKIIVFSIALLLAGALDTLDTHAELTDNLIAYYNMSTDGADQLNNYDMSAVGSPTHISGKVNNAADFSSADYYTDSTADFDTLGDMTVNFWLNTTNNSNQYMVCWGDNGIDDTFACFLTLNGGVPAYYVRDNNVNRVRCYGTTNITRGGYNMLTYIFNSSGGFIFVNGTEEFGGCNIGSQSYDGRLNQAADARNKLTVPTRWYNGAAGLSLTGQVDELAIYNRSLGDAEINTLFDSGSGLVYPFSKPVLVSLNYPHNGLTLNASPILFNWTYTGSFASATCNLTVNNSVLDSKSCTNATACTSSQGIANGAYDWNVTCQDTQSINTSLTYNFDTNYSLLLVNVYDEETETLITSATVYLDMIEEGVNEYNFTTNTGIVDIGGVTSGNYEFQYYASGYNNRRRNLYVNATMSSQSINVSLLNSSNSANSVVRVIDENRNAIEGATVKIEREYGANFIEVNELLTNIEGESTSDFIRNTVNYRFKVYVNDVLIKTTAKTLIFQDTLTIQVAITEDQLESIRYYTDASTSLSIANVSGKMMYSFTWAGNNVKGARLTVYKSILTDSDIVETQNTSSASFGTITARFTPEANYRYTAVAEIDTNTTGSYFPVELLEYKITSSIAIWGVLGAFLTFLIVVGFSVMRAEHPTAVIIAGMLGLIVSVFFGLIDITYGIIMLFVAVAAVIIFGNKT